MTDGYKITEYKSKYIGPVGRHGLLKKSTQFIVLFITRLFNVLLTKKIERVKAAFLIIPNYSNN